MVTNVAGEGCRESMLVDHRVGKLPHSIYISMGVITVQETVQVCASYPQESEDIRTPEPEVMDSCKPVCGGTGFLQEQVLLTAEPSL